LYTVVTFIDMEYRLKNASGTKLQVNGAAYGNGIYISPQAATSFGYCRMYGYSQSSPQSVRLYIYYLVIVTRVETDFCQMLTQIVLQFVSSLIRTSARVVQSGFSQMRITCALDSSLCLLTQMLERPTIAALKTNSL
jgi:hypothetical protein